MLTLFKTRFTLILLAGLAFTAAAHAARQPMPVGQRLENLRGNRKIDTKLIRSLTTIGQVAGRKKRGKTMLAQTGAAREISIIPVSGYGVEGRYDRLMSALQRRHLQIAEAGIRHGRALILLRIRTTQERDDLVDIIYRSQRLIQTASAVDIRPSTTRYARGER